jgi:hypothetical protein
MPFSQTLSTQSHHTSEKSLEFGPWPHDIAAAFLYDRILTGVLASQLSVSTHFVFLNPDMIILLSNLKLLTAYSSKWVKTRPSTAPRLPLHHFILVLSLTSCSNPENSWLFHLCPSCVLSYHGSFAWNKLSPWLPCLVTFYSSLKTTPQSATPVLIPTTHMTLNKLNSITKLISSYVK